MSIPHRFPPVPPRASLCLALALAALLTGCGGGSDDGTSQATATPQAGEKFTVSGTRWVNTLIGYGEEKLTTDFDAYLQSAAAGGDIIWGTDLGLPVTLAGAGTGGADLTLYLFGDTDQLETPPVSTAKKFLYQRFETGPAGPLEGDAIGLSEDTDPSDGLHLSRIYRNNDPADATATRVCDDATKIDPMHLPNYDDAFRPVYLYGIHLSACEQRDPNTTPTGAWTVDDKIFMLAAVQDENDLFNARSYLAVSTDKGLSWTPINGRDKTKPKPFSQGGPLARFIHAFGLDVDAADYQDSGRSGPCLLPLPTDGDTRGVLLFGAGLWKASDVFLAFVSRNDLLAAAADPTHELSPWYFAGTDYRTTDGKRCWSSSEIEAVPIVKADDPSAYSRFEDACGTTVTEGGIGYTSVVHVDETLADGTRVDRLVMLLSAAYKGVIAGGGDLDADLGTVLVTGDPMRPWVWNLAVDPASHDGTLPASRQFRPLPVPVADNTWLVASEPHCKTSGIPWRTVAGYAPLLIDRYTRLSADGMGVDLYFLISRSEIASMPGDPNLGKVEGYHYVVDVMRTTLKPVP